MNRVGRPKMNEKNRRSLVLKVRVTLGEMKRIKRSAKKAKMTMSDLTRQRLLGVRSLR